MGGKKKNMNENKRRWKNWDNDEFFSLQPKKRPVYQKTM